MEDGYYYYDQTSFICCVDQCPHVKPAITTTTATSTTTTDITVTTVINVHDIKEEVSEEESEDSDDAIGLGVRFGF